MTPLQLVFEANHARPYLTEFPFQIEVGAGYFAQGQRKIAVGGD